MKKKSIIFFLLPTLCFSQITQELNKTGLEQNSLRGKVSKLKIFHFDVDYENDSLIIKPYSGSFGFVESVNHFNKKGNLTSIDYINSTEDSKKISSTKVFYYNQNNRLDSIISNSERTHSKTTYKYLSDSLIIVNSSIISKSGILSSTISTHKLNNNIEDLNLKGDSFFRNYRFVYDNKNRVLRKEEFYDTDSIQSLTVYNYPNTNSLNPDAAIVYLPNQSITNIIGYQYEKNGNLIKVETKEFLSKNNEKIDSSHIFNTLVYKIDSSYTFNTVEYKFDSINNWTEKREFYPSGKLKELIKREIIYYE